jgi:outer membrane protein OmpA-like peptidoglycan-associated protein
MGILAQAFCLMMALPAVAQQPGPLTFHTGLQITRAYTSVYGPDAEEFNKITSVTEDGFDIDYSDTRGIAALRTVRAIDREEAQIYVIGFAEEMPQVLQGTTSLGLSTRTLKELRNNGEAAIALIYDTSLKPMNGVLTMVERNVITSVLIEQQPVDIPVMRVAGAFKRGKRTATGDFTFLDNKNQPVLISYDIKFDFEERPRTVRTVRISAGSQREAMEHTLRTLRRLDLYGIHFDFDKATLHRQTAALVRDIGEMLKDNPTWTLSIEGHTDSIGDAGYNQGLSERRAAAVITALVNRHGVAAPRLQSVGRGESNPKTTNDTLQGRAINRRVELVRTDR